MSSSSHSKVSPRVDNAKSTDINPPPDEVILKRLDKARKCFQQQLTSLSPASRLAWRQAQLARLHTLLTQHEEELCQAIAKDLGRTRQEAYFLDILPCLNEIVYFQDHLDELCADERVSGGVIHDGTDSCTIRPIPKGLVLIICPWNYPIQLALGPFIAALAAGNTIIMKLSEVSVHTSAVLARLMNQYMDADAFFTLTGDIPVSTLLLQQRFDHIFYTGNGMVGRIVYSAAVKHLCPVTLELGGKSPVYVDHDVHVPTVAKRICWAKFINCGQTCVAPDYILVHKDVRDEFIRECKATLESFYGSIDVKACPYYPRIINERQCMRLIRIIEEATASAVSPDAPKVVVGGTWDLEARFISPTIITCPVSFEGKLLKEEIFGPIMPVIAVASLGEAVQYVNSNPVPLALYSFSRKHQVNERFLNSTQSGIALENDLLMNMMVQNLPFGGVGESGLGGAYHGKHGFDTFTHRRAVMSRPHTFEIVNFPRYPPVSSSVKWSKLMRFILLRRRALLKPWLAKWLGQVLAVSLLFSSGYAARYFTSRK